MAGYNGYSMSNNAVAAYASGEKPLTKWTKSVILEEIEENTNISEEKFATLGKMTSKELKDAFLFASSWHHTSKFYNCTDFFSLDFEKIEEITIDEVKEIIANRPKKAKRSAEEIEAEKAAKAAKQAEKDAKIEKENLFKYQTKYKSLSGFMKSTTIDLEKLRKIRLEKIAEKREQLRKTWTAQGYEYGLKNIESDEFVEDYIR